MLTDRMIRRSIWATVPYHFVGAWIFGVPKSWPGRLVGLPPTPPIYAWNLGFLIALFGLAYAWMASQPKINRPMLAFSAVAKIGVFVVAAILAATGSIRFLLLLAVLGDLIFGSLWLAWLAKGDSAPTGD